MILTGISLTLYAIAILGGLVHDPNYHPGKPEDNPGTVHDGHHGDW